MQWMTTTIERGIALESRRKPQRMDFDDAAHAALQKKAFCVQCGLDLRSDELFNDLCGVRPSGRPCLEAVDCHADHALRAAV